MTAPNTPQNNYRIVGYADDRSEVEVELSDVELNAVVKVLTAIESNAGYVPSFTVHEINDRGDSIREVIGF